MAGFLVEAAKAVQGLQCQILAANEYVAGAVGRFNPVTRITAPIALNGIRRLLGCPQNGDFETPPPPFIGGQCECGLYGINARVQGTSDQTGNPFVRELTGIFFGPISNLVRFAPAEFRFGHRGQYFDESSTCGEPQFSNIPIGFPSGDAAVTLFEVVIFPASGDCGNPPIDYPPPSNFTTNTNITYNIDNGDEVTVTVPFVFAPITANFNGTLRIPFTFDLGGIEFSGNIDLGPDFDVTINPPALPPASGDDTDTLPPGDPADEVDPLPLDQKIIGVAVSSSIIGEQQLTTILTQGMPNILAPRAGSIKFAYSLGIATFWSSDIDVKSDRTFIPCPFSQGADAVVVSPAPGVAVQWVPIRGFPLATTQDVQGSSPAP